VLFLHHPACGDGITEITKRAVRIFEVIKLVDIKAKTIDEACDELMQELRVTLDQKIFA
jgi:serine phosphatase RsbU (regulator of sigma subunit)